MIKPVWPWQERKQIKEGQENFRITELLLVHATAFEKSFQ